MYSATTSSAPGQLEVIEAVVAGRDFIAVMPTGAGKSLTFQVPARLLDGTVLVVSPLISLMKDQVDALTHLGFRAAAINSSLELREREQRLRTLAAGEYELVYLAPEGLGRAAQPRGWELADLTLCGGRGSLHQPVGTRLPALLPASSEAQGGVAERAGASPYSHSHQQSSPRHHPPTWHEGSRRLQGVLLPAQSENLLQEEGDWTHSQRDRRAHPGTAGAERHPVLCYAKKRWTKRPAFSVTKG